MRRMTCLHIIIRAFLRIVTAFARIKHSATWKLDSTTSLVMLTRQEWSLLRWRRQSTKCWNNTAGGPVPVEVPNALLSMTTKQINSGSTKTWYGNALISHRGSQWSDFKWRWCSLSLISFRNFFKPWKVSLMFVTWQVFILVRPVSASAGKLPPCWCHKLVIHWHWTSVP